MSKSIANDAGVIRLLDPPDVVRRKVARAVTDSDTGPDAVRVRTGQARRHQPARHPRGRAAGRPTGITTYGALKSAVTEAVVATLEPLQKTYAELAADPAYVDLGLRRRLRALPRGHRLRPRRRHGRDGFVRGGGCCVAAECCLPSKVLG